MQILSGIAADLAGWAAVITGLGVFVHLLALDDRRKRARDAVKAAGPASRLEPGGEWHKITDVIAWDLARAPELAAMQARAALQIDAAEHAYNRVLADCAKACRLPVAPTFQPMRQLARQPEPPARRPLAA